MGVPEQRSRFEHLTMPTSIPPSALARAKAMSPSTLNRTYSHAVLRVGLAVGPGLLPGLLVPLAGTTGAGPYRQVGLSVPP